MRWVAKRKEPEKRVFWHNWYAWYPVKTTEGEYLWVWLETIERKGTIHFPYSPFSSNRWTWEYKLKTGGKK